MAIQQVSNPFFSFPCGPRENTVSLEFRRLRSLALTSYEMTVKTITVVAGCINDSLNILNDWCFTVPEMNPFFLNRNKNIKSQ